MNKDTDATLETLARFVQVIGRDHSLTHRFWQLAGLSPIQRSNEIHIMAEQMMAEDKDPELVTVFRMFGDERVFEAAVVAMRECGYIEK